MSDQQLQNMTFSRPRGTVTREEGKSYLYLIFGTFDPLCLHASALKPKMVERVILIQDLGDRNRLFALLAVFKRNLAVLVRAGVFHLDPDHPHRHNLDTFRVWLDEHGIDNRELRFTEPGSYERIATQGVVRCDDFSGREDSEIRKQFIDWRMRRDLL